MDDFDQMSHDQGQTVHPMHGPARFIVPFSIFFFLFLVNGFFWFDYTTRKYKTSLIRQDVKTLLSATEEEQKAGLEESKNKLSVFEKENSILLAELASSTNLLAAAEAELLSHESDMLFIASSTEREKKKNAALSRDIVEIKKILLPL